jgi:hypothetical protein
MGSKDDGILSSDVFCAGVLLAFFPDRSLVRLRSRLISPVSGSWTPSRVHGFRHHGGSKRLSRVDRRFPRSRRLDARKVDLDGPRHCGDFFVVNLGSLLQDEIVAQECHLCKFGAILAVLCMCRPAWRKRFEQSSI